MTDNKITREKTFSEELPYFKERIQEVFDYYDNPKGCAEMLYIDVLRDSNRIVRKAEEEINRQKAEYNNLLEQFRILDYECGRLEKADENQKAEIERLQKEVNLVSIQFQDLQERYEEAQTEIERLKGYPYAIQVEVSKKLESQIKSEAIQEFAERLKEKSYKTIRNYGLTKDVVEVCNIDNLVKEMVGEK